MVSKSGASGRHTGPMGERSVDGKRVYSPLVVPLHETVGVVRLLDMIVGAEL